MRSLVAALLLPLIVSGCIPLLVPGHDWYPIPLDQTQAPADPELLLKPDDSVRVRLKTSDKVRPFTVAALTDTGFIGIGGDNKRYRVRYADAEIIWVRRFEWHHGEIDLQPDQIKPVK